MYVYDSRRIFFPANAPAKAIPIKIESSGEISSAKNVQDAVQLLADGVAATIGELPPGLDDNATLRNTVAQLNQVIAALKCLKIEPKKDNQ